MKQLFSERNMVILLFIVVLVMFSFAQEDTRKMEKHLQEPSAEIASPSDHYSQIATEK